MKFKYSIREIPGKGKGIISEEYIPKDTLIWEFQPQEAKIFGQPSELEHFLSDKSHEEKLKILSHIFCSGSEAILLMDDTQYTNHDSNSNTYNSPDLKKNFAARDIHPGEEMTDNYGKFHELDWFEEICKKYSMVSSNHFPESL